MKRYKSSDLTNKRAEVIKEARDKGVIIECRNTNGEVVDELIIMAKSDIYRPIEIMYDLLQDEVYRFSKLDCSKPINEFIFKLGL